MFALEACYGAKEGGYGLEAIEVLFSRTYRFWDYPPVSSIKLTRFLVFVSFSISFDMRLANRSQGETLPLLSAHVSAPERSTSGREFRSVSSW